MTRLITATYDGSALQLDEPLPLEPNTRVVISVESTDSATRDAAEDVSFFDIALGMDLGGPPDWSARIDDYLYGGMVGDAD